MPKRKAIKIVLILGILVLIAAPFLGYFLDKLTLLDRSPLTISEDSSASMQDAFAYQFEVEKDEKITIEFSVYYANVSATLKIFGKGTYNQELALDRSPSIPTGLLFVYSQFVWGQSPSTYTSSANSMTISTNGYWYIEFAGSTSGDYLISIPGYYVVVVYGSNTGPPADTDVKFNLLIKIDGPGDLLEEIFYYIGTGILVGLVLIVGYSYYKKLRRGI